MKTEQQVELDGGSSTATTAGIDTDHATALAERERIKAIIALGGAKELTDEAIDKLWSVEATALKVNAYLKAQLDEMRANRALDAKVLEDIKQDPAGEIKVSGDQKNVFGI